MHPRPPATKRARVSFDLVLPVPVKVLIDQGGSATGYPGGGWGGHWPRPIRTEMPQPATGNGKEAMEPPTNTTSLQDVQPPAAKRHAGPRHTGSSCQHQVAGAVVHATGGWGSKLGTPGAKLKCDNRTTTASWRKGQEAVVGPLSYFNITRCTLTGLQTPHWIPACQEWPPFS